MNYRHYVTIGSTKTEVFPLNFLETSLVDEPVNSMAFYRRKFAGALTFYGDDFDLFYAAELVDSCGKIIYEIELNSNPYWDGCFSTTDGTFDLDKCTFEISPLQNDYYVDILDRAGNQYNILGMGSPVTVKAMINGSPLNYTRNRWLSDIIEYLGTNATDGIKPGATISSQFFTDATNYVTQETNHLTLLTIAQKSDILRPTSSNPATNAMLSWNQLMEILWGMFQVTWNYDSATDTINVEHISWFAVAAGLDLRTQLISHASNKYNYTKEKMLKYEIFTFAEADQEDFVGTNIMYINNCVDNDPDTNKRETHVNVTTDLDYILTNPEAIADEGFVIFCNYLDSGSYYVAIEGGAISSTVRLNMHLSWANLHNRYFRHNRILIEGYLNDVLTTFWTAQKTKLQEIYAQVCPSDNYDPADYITTKLGETWFGGIKGFVRRSELKPSGEMKFELIYGPANNTPTPIEDSKWILITETDCGVFSVLLSEAPAGNIDIIIDHKIYLGEALVCTGAPATWTIAAGSYYDDYSLVLCSEFGYGVNCLELTITPPAGWNYTLVRYTNCDCE